MIKLFFEINGAFRQYTCEYYLIENEFYVFVDLLDGKKRRLHKSFYKGEEKD